MSAPGVRRRDLASGGIGVLFSLAVCAGALTMPMGTRANPGPAFLPFWSGLALAGMSLALLAHGWLGRGGDREDGAGEERRVALVMIGLLGYALALEALGYVPTTFLLLAALARILGQGRWPLALGFAALATVGSWALFGLWLGVPLPSGVLGR